MVPEAQEDLKAPSAFRQSEMFSGLARERLAELASKFKAASFGKGDTILLEGQDAGAFHLVSQGKVKVVQTSAEGTEIILHIFEPGGILGALPTVGEGTYPASAIALEPVKTYFITAADFEDLMIRHPRVMRNLLRFATRMLQAAHRRLRELATERVERRIARTLTRLTAQLGKESESGVSIDAPLSRQDLAEMSGTTLYTVSRTLKAWEREGLIKASRKHITILRPHELVVIAEDLPDTSH